MNILIFPIFPLRFPNQIMKYDIFISYSQHDNATHGNWIHRFHDKLVADFRSRSGIKLIPFLDKENINAGDVLSGRLKNALNETRILIPVLSPTYLSSPWCRQEFLHFMDQAGELIVDDKCRIVPVQLMPYNLFEPEEGAAREVERITGFLNDNSIFYADFYKDPLPIRPDENEFGEKIAQFSKDIFELHKTVREALEEISNPADTSEDAIFIGYTASGSKNLRDSLIRELQHQRKYGKINYRILPDEAPDAPEDLKTMPTGQLEDFLRRQLSASAFSVHLFDDLEGVKSADSREPVVHLQYRLAKETAAAKPGFRLFTAQSDTDECPASQEQFLRGVADDARQIPQLETLPAFEVKAIKDFLLEKIKLREEKPIPATSNETPRRVFFIHDHRDKDDPICTRIDDLIYEQQHDVYVPVFREDDPHVDPDFSFRDFWLVCNKAVVLLRSATTAWCNAIKVELIKTATEKQSPYAMAICVTDPEVAKRIREVRSHEFHVIDCTKQGYELQLIQFLNAPRHA